MFLPDFMVFQCFQNSIDQLKVWYVLYLLIKLFFSANLKILYIILNAIWIIRFFFFQGTLWSSDLHRTRKRAKNQTYRGKGGKVGFFHILMLDRLGYNWNHCTVFLVKYPFISAINANIQNPLKYFEALN